eukprot:9120186-Alexandrium_andersonii.AAC.1
MHHANGLGSETGRSKSRRPASDPPTDGCCRVLESGAIGAPDANEALEVGVGVDELVARQGTRAASGARSTCGAARCRREGGTG